MTVRARACTGRPRAARAPSSVAAALLAVGCGGAATPPPPPAPAPPAPLRLTLVELPPEGGGALAADEARLVADDVARRRADPHGVLPEVEARRNPGDGPPAWPRVSVVNETPHGLVVWFAGECPRTVGLAPRQNLEVELCAGDYDIAAQLDDPDFLPFVGRGDRVDDGYTYRLTFYVVAEPGGRTLRRRPR